MLEPRRERARPLPAAPATVHNEDARWTGDFGNLRFGVDQGRRGWLEAGNIVNTRAVAEQKAMIRAMR